MNERLRATPVKLVVVDHNPNVVSVLAARTTYGEAVASVRALRVSRAPSVVVFRRKLAREHLSLAIIDLATNRELSFVA